MDGSLDTVSMSVESGSVVQRCGGTTTTVSQRVMDHGRARFVEPLSPKSLRWASCVGIGASHVPDLADWRRVRVPKRLLGPPIRTQ